MNVISNEGEIRDGYNAVRSDSNDLTWLLLKYQDKNIVVSCTGVLYDEFLVKLTDDERAYGYIRLETGDEMSRRAKFVFLTWIGPGVSALKKAKVSTDKAFIKQIFVNFSTEILADDKCDIKYEKLKEAVDKAGGAIYGTGK